MVYAENLTKKRDWEVSIGRNEYIHLFDEILL